MDNFAVQFFDILYLICILVVVGYYFQVRRVSLIPVYCVAAYGFIRSGIMYFQMVQLENDFAFIVRTICLAAVAGYMGLTVYQAYALEIKWRAGAITVFAQNNFKLTGNVISVESEIRSSLTRFPMRFFVFVSLSQYIIILSLELSKDIICGC